MTTHCKEYGQLTRRSFLGGGLQSAAALMLGQLNTPDWLPNVVLADPHVGPRGDTLVCIFLRGGADGLNMVVPFGDDAYYAARPRLAIGRPDHVSAESNAIELDGFFGLHPALKPLVDIYKAGDLALVHAAGSPDESRSHFVAQALMEQGLSEDYTGWLARHLATLDTGNDSAVRAIGVGDMLQQSLRGAVSATVLRSTDSYRLAVAPSTSSQLETVFDALYRNPDHLLTNAAQQTLNAIDMMQQVARDRSSVSPAYGRSALGQSLSTVAELIHADVGVEVACVDFGGWDTHAAQGAGTGQMANLLTALATELATFYADLQEKMSQVTVVVMSEFGRRVAENGSGGTDHGHGNALFVMGGNVNGGQVFADWPGLETEQLEGKGDLAITTDYRDVLGELVRKRLNNPRIADVFPDHLPLERGLFL